jgi:hypothetical protein
VPKRIDHHVPPLHLYPRRSDDMCYMITDVVFGDGPGRFFS